jgi:acyl-CoA synthetase (AMP-forming)/AMP-acid ligase II
VDTASTRSHAFKPRGCSRLGKGADESTGRSPRGLGNVAHKMLTRQNAPSWVWFLGHENIPSELPKTASGKVMKNVLRDWAGTLATVS